MLEKYPPLVLLVMKSPSVYLTWNVPGQHLLPYTYLRFFMWKAFQVKDTVLPKCIFNEKCQFQ